MLPARAFVLLVCDVLDARRRHGKNILSRMQCDVLSVDVRKGRRMVNVSDPLPAALVGCHYSDAAGWLAE